MVRSTEFLLFELVGAGNRFLVHVFVLLVHVLGQWLLEAITIAEESFGLHLGGDLRILRKDLSHEEFLSQSKAFDWLGYYVDELRSLVVDHIVVTDEKGLL